MNNIFGHYVPRGLLFSFVAEILILFTSIVLSILIADLLFYHNSVFNEKFHLYFYSALYIAIMSMSMIATGLYQRDLPADFYILATRLAVSLAFGSLILFGLNELLSLEFFSFYALSMSALFSFGGIISSRMMLYSESKSIRRNYRVLVIGTGNRASRLKDHLNKPGNRSTLLGPMGTRLIGYIDTQDTNTQTHLNDNLIIRLGNTPLSQYAIEKNIDEIIVALDERRNMLQVDDLLECRMHGIRITDVTTFIERESGNIMIDDFQPNSLIFSEGSVQAIRIKSKRFVDLLASLTILFLSLPIMLVTILAIWLESGLKGSILYRQERVGLNGRTFQLLKFRSMVENAEKGGAVWAQQNDSRVTKVGRFIRKTRIDELPQLFNVLKGDMSMVGPRPERPQFVSELTEKIPYYNLRHYVMPGVTGWAQICFPYGASVEDARRKLEYELYYIKNYSVFLDILILLQTVSVVLLGKGAR